MLCVEAAEVGSEGGHHNIGNYIAYINKGYAYLECGRTGTGWGWGGGAYVNFLEGGR
jgi:hypothetical protein